MGLGEKGDRTERSRLVVTGQPRDIYAVHLQLIQKNIECRTIHALDKK